MAEHLVLNVFTSKMIIESKSKRPQWRVGVLHLQQKRRMENE